MPGNVRKHTPYDYNVICDICGRKRKKSETVMAYGTGDIAVVLSCIDGCADDRHPLNSPPPVIFDAQPVPDARPDSTEDNNETFVDQPIISSYMTWGHLQGAGLWGKLNNSNSDFNFNPVWYWGFFRRA